MGGEREEVGGKKELDKTFFVHDGIFETDIAIPIFFIFLFFCFLRTVGRRAVWDRWGGAEWGREGSCLSLFLFLI